MPGVSSNSVLREFGWASYITLIVWAVVIPIYFTGLGFALPITSDDLAFMVRWSAPAALACGLWSARRGGPLVVTPPLVTLGVSTDNEVAFTRSQTVRHLLAAGAVGACAGSALVAISARRPAFVEQWVTTSASLALAAMGYVACAQVWHRRRLIAVASSGCSVVAAVLSLPSIAVALPALLCLAVVVAPPRLALPAVWARAKAGTDAQDRLALFDMASALSLLRGAADGACRQRLVGFPAGGSSIAWYYLRVLCSLPKPALLRLAAAPVVTVALANVAASAHLALVLIGVALPFFTLSLAEPMSALEASSSSDVGLWPAPSWRDAAAVVLLTVAITSPLLLMPGSLGVPAALAVTVACGLAHALWAKHGRVDLSALPVAAGHEALTAHAAVHGLGPWLVYLSALAAIGIGL